MDYNKAEVIKDCRELLHLINCEIVVDVSDGQLFNVLFQSDVKKETLLKWLIQQMYSIESYTNNSMEDLVSMFISKSQYRSFLIGTMPISEQYKKWKLIMSALHKKQKRLDCNETIDYDEGITSGNLLVKYEKFWNEKSDFALKYINPTIELPKKANFHELQAEMETAKELLSQWKSEEKCNTEKLNVEENRIPPFESYKRSNENFNKVLEQEFLPYLTNARNAEGQYAFRYEHLDPKIIKNITKHAQALNNNMETMNGVLRGIENCKNQEQANATLN